MHTGKLTPFSFHLPGIRVLEFAISRLDILLSWCLNYDIIVLRGPNCLKKRLVIQLSFEVIVQRLSVKRDPGLDLRPGKRALVRH